MTGWEVTEWSIALTAIIAAVAALWKAAGVVRSIRDGVDFVQSMMRPNGGSSVIDRLARLELRVEGLARTNAAEDVVGRRYGPDNHEIDLNVTLKED
jgi:hypothetical protein